jgi:DNA transformation protein
MASESEADPLQALPNIGAEVASRLCEAGITTPDELRRLGSIEAAVRLKAARPGDPPCRSMLSGLEGAIRGVCWHAIPKDERDRLWEGVPGLCKRDRGGDRSEACQARSGMGPGPVAAGHHGSPAAVASLPSVASP